MTPVKPRLGKVGVGVIYVLMTVSAGALFLAINGHGQTLTAPAPAPGAPVGPTRTGTDADILLHVLLALAAVIVAGQILGALFVYIGQPPVIGEVVAGILLGPSLLGEVAP